MGKDIFKASNRKGIGQAVNDSIHRIGAGKDFIPFH